MNLLSSYNSTVYAAFVITLRGSAAAERMAGRAVQSCVDVGMDWVVWDAFDGTGAEILPPGDEIYSRWSWLSWIKQTNKLLQPTEVACALSHISLWAKCIELDQPIVILEHDAVMVHRFAQHPIYNSIIYLGHRAQMEGVNSLFTPPHAVSNLGFHFLCGAHAYAIDPAVAKSLLAHVVQWGIHQPLDVMIRADLFPIAQTGLYAYNASEETTITGRLAA